MIRVSRTIKVVYILVILVLFITGVFINGLYFGNNFLVWAEGSYEDTDDPTAIQNQEQNQGQSQNQTQNNKQNQNVNQNVTVEGGNSSSSSSSSSSVSIETNNRPEAKKVTYVYEQPRVIAQAPTEIKELPRTGLPLAGVGLASLLPGGILFKKLLKRNNINEESANIIWTQKQLKS